MKTQTNNRKMATWVAVCASLVLAASLTVGAADNKQGFIDKMEQWQDKMSEKFRDTWKSLRRDDKPGVGLASVDLREDSQNYIVRLNLPNRDLAKVEVKVDGETLRIVAPAGEKAGRYEQALALAGIKSGAEPKVDRRQKDSMIVVTVPKDLSGANRLTLSPFSSLAPLSEWDRDIFAQMKKMREEMDRSFEEAFKEFRTFPEHKAFFDEPRFGSSVEMKEEGDNYVVHAYLPDRNMQNIHVTVEDRTLKIAAKEEAETKRDGTDGPLHSTRKAAYSQILTLPGPVDSTKMKVDRKENMVVVTLPKAE